MDFDAFVVECLPSELIGAEPFLEDGFLFHLRRYASALAVRVLPSLTIDLERKPRLPLPNPLSHGFRTRAPTVVELLTADRRSSGETMLGVAFPLGYLIRSPQLGFLCIIHGRRHREPTER